MVIDNNELGRYLAAVLTNQQFILAVLAILLSCESDEENVLVCDIRKSIRTNQDAIEAIEKRVDGVGISKAFSG